MATAGRRGVVTFAKGRICDRWDLWLPDFRVDFHAERPQWELGRLEDVAERLEPGMRVLDIGAEHGDFTALYRSWGANVVPVEPVPQYWPCIRSTFEANAFPPPSAWFKGFAADETHLRGDDAGADSWPVCSRGKVVADYGFLHLAWAPEPSRITVDDMRALPASVWGVGPPDVLMIDVEGAEWNVLSGAEKTLTSRPVLVWVSVHPTTLSEWYGRTVDDLHALMESFGYIGKQLPNFGEAEEFWRFEKVS